jgi:3-methyladenine DNA glycosylase AlkD
MNTNAYLEALKAEFLAAADPAVADGQANYMRNKFSFYGIKTPLRRSLIKNFLSTHGLPSNAELKSLLLACFAEEYRELHYFGLDIAQQCLKQQEADFIQLMEQLILTNAWWDTVDWLASLIGAHFRRYPELITPYNERWMNSGNYWLQRVAIIFQLKYKEKTNQALLFSNILSLSDSNEFFIQKAAGWALRAYATTNPEAVKYFVQHHPLASLTKREALRRLDV